jgi:hypothetical protein
MTSAPKFPPDGLTLARLATPAKALVSGLLLTLAIGMVGALGQIIVHDIIPTFFSDAAEETDSADAPSAEAIRQERGDLFSDMAAAPAPEETTPFYKTEQFVWTLKWTHIHLFGMNMIFILLGGVTLLLDMSLRARSWLIALPFVGVFFDILTMWLKGYISPAFFWLHIPGGLLFGAIFIFVFFRAMAEMWFPQAEST